MRPAVKEIVSTITSKGQVTLPAEVRKSLGVKRGDKVIFVIAPEGNVQVKAPPYPDIESLAGAAGSLPHPLSWQEMQEIAHDDHIKEKFGEER